MRLKRPASNRPPAPAPARDADTRARLLRTATRTFAERGYRDVTVREVCRDARVNVAAVNYHFGSKEALYLEALREGLSRCHDEFETFIAAPAPRNRAEAAERLRGMIRGFAQRFLGEPDVHTKLIQREMLDPTFALDAVLKEFMLPRFRALRECIRPFLPDADDRALALHAVSVIGQLLFYRAASPIALRILGRTRYDAAFIEDVVEHVTRFTERGLASVPRGSGGRNGAREKAP